MIYKKEYEEIISEFLFITSLRKVFESEFNYMHDNNFHILTEDLLNHLSVIETFGDSETEEEFYNCYEKNIGEYIYLSKFGDGFTTEELFQLKDTYDLEFYTMDYSLILSLDTSAGAFFSNSSLGYNEVYHIAKIIALFEKNGKNLTEIIDAAKKYMRNKSHN